MQLDAVVAAWQADSCRLRVRLRVLKAVPSCFVYFLQLDAVVASLVTCIECSTFMFRVLHDGLHAVGGSGCESEAGICRVRGRLIWGYCIHTCIERSTLILQPITFGVSFLHSQIWSSWVIYHSSWAIYYRINMRVLHSYMYWTLYPHITTYCIWSVISSFSNFNRWSRSLGLFYHVPSKRDHEDWDWRLRLNDNPNVIGYTCFGCAMERWGAGVEYHFQEI